MRSKVTVIWRFLATLAVFFGVGGWLGGGSALAGSFHQAAFQGRLEMVKKQIASKKNEINESDGYGSTPLHHAAMGGQMEMTTWLIKNGAVVDSHNSGGATSLLLAVRSGKMEVAKALVEAGADVHVVDNLGGGVLAGAAYYGDSDLVEMLLNHGAKVNSSSQLGLTPLHMATLANAKTVMKILLERGADANARDSLGETPLNKVKDEEARQLLMSNGARMEKNRDDVLVEQANPEGMEK